MTKKELSKLFYLNREIELEKGRLKELQAAAADSTVKISGLPHVSGEIRKTERMSILIDEQKNLIDLKIKESVIEYNRLNRYILGIPDPLIRQILLLRFVEGMSWVQVAVNIGGDNSPDSVRMACERFLKSR